MKRHALLVLILFLNACAYFGPMDVEETFYLAVPSGENINFYRIRVDVETRFTDAKYYAYWLPADAVDQLYGGNIEEFSANAVNTEKELKEAVNKAILDTHIAYLNAAKDPNSSSETIKRLLNAQRLVRATAGDGIALPDGAVEMEYNPEASMVMRRSGQKLVFFLTADPTKVLENIEQFSHSKATSAGVLKLAQVVQQNNSNQVAALESQNNANQKLDGALVSKINDAKAATENKPDKNQLNEHIRTLLFLLESM